ncbi:DUF2637 domain-containing protein [Streptomyces sp. A1277]|uniref:DUF2637 domain-containing protein n=1 Tax=Streptomyces sp. A1277 TaxID=2563103 RepID=UPI0010A20F21|nr:DUF2637 domain-containing protein [Streptomyces sp. A1277]THA31773.1 DUF2637 domain-containing protein [Streptomyces sp. A1277]
MKTPTPSRGLAAGAATVTVLLTAAAFWLSYEHLHDVADLNGLDGERAWAWPATVDLFIVAGELLILRASLQHRVDAWAIALAASGSLGSIALNVAGVGAGAEAMEYIVAAVPPVAALLAFGALMRQVHDALAGHHERPRPRATAARPTPELVPAGARLLPLVSLSVATEVTTAAAARPLPEVVPAGVRFLPLVPGDVTAEVTIERVGTEPEQVVTRPSVETTFKMLDWSSLGAGGNHQRSAELTTALAAAEPRQVVTVPVTITPAELRRQARTLNRQVVAETNRPVTIERLRDEFGLSRRDATELRREIVGSSRS